MTYSPIFGLYSSTATTAVEKKVQYCRWIRRFDRLIVPRIDAGLTLYPYSDSPYPRSVRCSCGASELVATVPPPPFYPPDAYSFASRSSVLGTLDDKITDFSQKQRKQQ